jgi:hypothetical protein
MFNSMTNDMASMCTLSFQASNSIGKRERRQFSTCVVFASCSSFLLDCIAFATKRIQNIVFPLNLDFTLRLVVDATK